MQYKYLESRPDRASGELTLKGTRIRIAMVINMLANGFTLETLHNEHFPQISINTLRKAVEEATELLSQQANASKFYKHKLLLDEHISPRQFFTRLNAHFDVKHIDHDLHHAGMDDPTVFELAVSQGRIILTKNVKDFRPLLREDSPGVIGIPETWSNERVDTKLTALLMQHGPNYFRGRYRSLAAEDQTRQAA